MFNEIVSQGKIKKISNGNFVSKKKCRFNYGRWVFSRNSEVKICISYQNAQY